jgi:DNA-binding IscR family transcriptional regulator
MPESLMLWRQLSNQVYDYLDGITLADAVESRVENPQSSLFHTNLHKSAA